jgi:hypothetical protein
MKVEDVTLDQLYEFMEKGDINRAPEHIVDYLHLIEKVRGMILRVNIYGNKEAVIKHLKLSDNLSEYKANKVYNETIQYFYVDSGISKEAWRNFYADKMDKLVNFSMNLVESVSDAAKIVKMCKEIAELRGVNIPDKAELPDGYFDKPINLLSLDASIFEFGKANRQGLEDFIDTLPELTEKERIRIKQETLILPLKIFPNEQENIRKG